MTADLNSLKIDLTRVIKGAGILIFVCSLVLRPLLSAGALAFLAIAFVFLAFALVFLA